ncbi:SMC5-SMC6 complex localization factor protein 1 isoform X3 [Phyllopteryx taeniolatus]|uniref:SMC5-SMC6 complex localization factor protein 1 isoform X3 n=1 Tax=Phyllopteryx taeniolatus TaxID=161469 RepID=UPI002AD53261|nr:SMC5-SMC6 complex localization factor protein 1 isoform X3 [Phyllopteryx taeniolatus]
MLSLGMERCTHMFQFSGIKNCDQKRALIQGIYHLSGKYIGGSVYQTACTHLIIPHVLASEKFLASCAAGKWVVTPDYVLDSVRNGSWLPEGLYEVAIPRGTMSAFYPARHWRKNVTSGAITGAFQGWKVLLMVQDASRSIMFKRVLEAGTAIVYSYPPPSHTAITHVIVKPITQDASSHNGPCFPVTHIIQYLFGRNCVDMKFNVTDDINEAKEASVVDVDFSKLEGHLRDHVIEQEDRPRLLFLEFLSYHDPHHPLSQVIETDFGNIGTMIECGLFIEALDTIRSAVFPGILPPAPYLVALIEYAQQGSATTLFLRTFQQIMHRLLVANPPWLAPANVKKYYSRVLQCPHCKMGQWPFLETAISYCLSSEATCHQLPGPALPTLLNFYNDVLAFFLKLFQGELYSITGGTFWTVWERSTLLSCAVKKLVQLMMQAASGDNAESDEEPKWHLLAILLDLLSVLVEFWYRHHCKLNHKLVEKGLKDLADHFAISSQYLSSVVLAEMVARISSTRLKLALVDAIFRNICCTIGITLAGEPLSLKKVMLSYLPALGRLAQSQSWTHHTTKSCSSLDTNCGTLSSVENESRKECIPRGLNKVNAAAAFTHMYKLGLYVSSMSPSWNLYVVVKVADKGETLLHRACKRNQVETVIQILERPGIDVNVKDHVGWTPLHEACNYGSTACVEALLRHWPTPLINYVVDGVSPLHDALLNGHMDIAKMLLEAAGSELLQQADEKGRTTLDLTSDTSERAELIHSAQVGDSKLNSAKVLNHALLEAGSCMLVHLLVCYQQEKGLPGSTLASDVGHTLVRGLEAHSLQRVTLGWTDQRAVSLADDTHTLLELARGKHSGQVCEAVKAYEGENTVILMVILGSMQSKGQTLLAEVNRY